MSTETILFFLTSPFPPTRIFLSIGYHYVQKGDDFEPAKLVEIFKEMWPEKDWDIVASLNERNAKKKKVKYTG